jgi:hypothetical protein
MIIRNVLTNHYKMENNFFQLTEKQAYALQIASANIDTWLRKYRKNHKLKEKKN